ncbi:MAG: phosphoenolpyruvate carboxylase, partial [Nitrososphaerales archaeon]
MRQRSIYHENPIPSYGKISSDIHLLGDMLGETIVEQEGRRVFNLEESLRTLSKYARGEREGKKRVTLAKIVHLVGTLSYEECLALIHSFSTYFQLVNVAEDHHRVRVLRNWAAKGSRPSVPRVPESIYDLVFTLREHGMNLKQVVDFFSNLRVELVFTAHPNEARRRTVLLKAAELMKLLLQLDSAAGGSLERRDALQKIRTNITALWQTDELRNSNPTVLDEVKNGLYYLENVVFPLVPLLYQRIRDALYLAYGEQGNAVAIPSCIFFGSWRGSDRDGNPNVTPRMTIDTVKMLREALMKLYDGRLFELVDKLSQSTRITTFSP